jgi:zinc/manganese transport system permease protein
VNWEGFDLDILGPAFIAGLVVASIHVPLGRRVLQRGIIFLDLAVAQTAGLGIVAAHSFHWDPGGWEVQLIAVSAALVSSYLLHLTESRWAEIQEALIGSLFVVASSLGILLLAANPHGGEHLKELLVGQILWVDYAQLVPVALLYAVLAGVWFIFRQRESSLPFYLIFAVAVTASVQLVGVYLVFASLILPALAIRSRERNALLFGYLVAAAGYAAGLVLAALLDLPAGATIVCTLAVCALFTAFAFRPSRLKM